MNQESQETTPKVDFAELAKAGDWRGVINAAEDFERNIAGSERIDVLAARLWWATAQLALGSVPPSILAAPLESAAEELCSSEMHVTRPELAEIAGAALAKLATQLQAGNDPEAALRLQKLAFRADAKHGPALRSFLDRVISELERDPLLSCDFLRSDRLRELKVLAASMEAVPPTQEAKTVAQPTESESTSTNLNWVLSSPVVEGDSRQPALESYKQQLSADHLSHLKPGLSFKHIGIAATAFIIIALVVARYSVTSGRNSDSWSMASVGKIFDHIRGVDSEDAKVTISDTPAAPLLHSPSSERAVSNNLDALYYDISAQQAKKDSTTISDSVVTTSGNNAQLPNPSSASTGAVVAASSSASAPAEPAAQNPPALQPVKVSVNTSEPREDNQFRDRLAQAQERSRSASNRNQQTNDRVLFPEPNQPRRGPPPQQNRPRNNGSRYTIIARTSVMARPEYDAIRLTELRPGDEIEVETRMGNWLRILSRNGVYGFVLAQDARGQ